VEERVEAASAMVCSSGMCERGVLLELLVP
jgi:hypothetical protein